MGIYNLNGVSVVIVTHNGSERLLPVLKHLIAQKKIFFPWEILVVDNDSTDNTEKVVHDFLSEHNVSFRLVKEGKKGTMYARQRGIREAKFRYILFCDDDNWFNPLYINTAYQIIVSDPRIAAVGGKGIMEYEGGFKPPAWFRSYERNYGTGPQGREDGDTTDVKGCLYTAGAIFDGQWLKLLNDHGFTPTLKGRTGNLLTAGEDTELTYALKTIGGRLFYSSKMEFKHYMPRERITWNYLKRLWKSFGYADFIISPYLQYSKDPFFLSFLKKEVYNLKRVILLEIKYLVFRKEKEGSFDILERERKKGELIAVLKEFPKYRLNKKRVQYFRINKQT